MRKLKIIGMCLVILLVGGFVSIPIFNNYCAYKVEQKLCGTPLPEETRWQFRRTNKYL